MTKQWTLADMPDLNGKTAIVTGANSGLGFETSKALAGAGADVIMACRNQDKAQTAADTIRAFHPNAAVETMALDLADLGSVRSFAQAANKRCPHLHWLINNAGVMALPERRTSEGFEMQFGTNHLGHFALTGLLFERLKATSGARVVTESSLAHRFGKLRFDDLQWQRGYKRWPAYGQSKLANLMFALELDRRIQAQNLNMLSLAAHPGFASTHLQLAGPEMEGAKLVALGMKLGNVVMSQSQEQGALPTLYAAVSEDAASGDYIGPDGFQEIWGHPAPAFINRRARDAESAKRLWSISEKLTGVSFT